MTEKRFTDVWCSETGHIGITDKGIDKEFTGSKFKEFLNELSEENEQLRKEKIDVEVKLYSANEKILMQMDYDEIIKQNTKNEMEIISLKQENEQLKRKMEKVYNSLVDENEQLKTELTELKASKEDNYNITDGLW